MNKPSSSSRRHLRRHVSGKKPWQQICSASIATVAAFVGPAITLGAIYYWTGDNNQNWNTTLGAAGTNWSSSPDFNNGTGTTPGVGSQSGTSDVFFALAGANPSNLATFLGADTNIASLTFTPDAIAANPVSISGANTLSLGAGGITNNSNATISLNTTVALTSNQTWTNNSTSGKTLNVTGAITGSSNLSLGGVGSFAFSGQNTYSGATTLSTFGTTLVLSGANGSIQNTSAITLAGGTQLTLDSSVSGNHTAQDRIKDTLGITSTGGTLTLTGNATTPTTETVGTLTLGSATATGLTNVNVTGQGAVLTFGSGTLQSFVRNGVGTAVNFSVGTGAAVMAPKVTLSPTSGLIGGWATIGNINSNSSTNVLDFATVVGGQVVPVSNYVSNNLATDFAAGNNVKLSAPVTLGAATTTIDSLYMTGANSQLFFGSGATGTDGAPNILIITSGAIISNAATGSGGISNQPTMTQLAAIGSTFNGNNTQGPLLQGMITSGNGTDLIIDTASNLRLNSIITDNGSTSIGLTKNGAGILDLSDGNKQTQNPNGNSEIRNTYTGITTINGGTVLVNDDLNFGAVPTSVTPNSITLNGGTILTTRGFVFAANRGITVGPQGGTLAYEGGSNWTISQKIVGTGSVTFAAVPLGVAFNNPDTVTLNSPSGTNSYQGATTLVAQPPTGGGSATIFWRLPEQIPDSSAVTFVGSFTGAGNNSTFNMNNQAETIGSMASAAGIGVITNLGTFVTGKNNLSTSYGGTIAGGGSFTKIGTGTQTLAGATSYTGATSIGTTNSDGGTLLVNNLMSGTSGVTVGFGTSHSGTLGGSGTINASVTVNSLGHLAPAVTPTSTSTLTLGNDLTIAGGASFDFNFGAANATLGQLGTSDQISVGSGTITLQSGVDTLNITALTGFGIGLYPLIVGAGTFNDAATFSINGSSNFNYKVLAPGSTIDAGGGGGTVPANALYLEVTAGNPTLFWTGKASGNPNGNWDLSTPNWASSSGSVPFANGDNVVFDDANLASGGSTNLTVAAAGVSPNSILFNLNGSDITIGGSGSINITGTSIVKQQGNAVTFNTNVTTPVTTVSAGTLTISANKTYSSTSSFTATGGTVNVNGTLFTPQLTVGSAAALNVGANGSLDSATNLNLGGTGKFQNGVQSLASLTGKGSLTLQGTGLTLTGSSAFGGVISGTGSVNVSSGATVTLSGANSFSGGGAVGGNLALLASSTVAGTFELPAGGVLTAAPGALGTANIHGTGGSMILTNTDGSLTSTNSGLVGSYYNTTPANTNNSNPNFASLAALTTHLTSLGAPATTAITTTGSITALDFSNNNATTTPPFASQGFASSTNYEASLAGEINITTPGSYTFTTTSDDGSVLFIDGNLVVNNNFFQGFTARSGTVGLGVGLHNIQIGYFQGTGGNGLLVGYTPPGGANATLPNSVLYNAVPSVTFGTDLLVSSDTSIDVPTAVSATMGQLTMAAGTNLSAPDGGLKFTKTTLGGAGTYTFTPGSFGIVLGPILGAGSIDIEKNGAGALVLDNNQTAQLTDLTNSINVNQGSLVLVGAAGGFNPAGASTINLNSVGGNSAGALVLSSSGGNVTFDMPVNMTTGGTIFAQQYGTGVAGPITVTVGGGNNISVGSGDLSLGAANNYSLAVAGAITAAANVNITAGTVSFNSASNTIGGNLNVSAGATLNASTQINGLAGQPGLVANGTVNLTMGSQTFNSVNGAATGVINLAGNGTVGTALTVSATSSYNGVIKGIGSLLSSAPTLTLSNGSSTYTGGTTIQGGTLLITNATGSATGTGPVDIGPGSTIAGTGGISGALTVEGNISPGNNGIGTLRFGSNVAANTGSALVFDVSNFNNNDAISVVGALTIDPASGVTINGLTGFTVGRYVLANATGGVTLPGSLPLSLTGLVPSGESFALSTQGNQLVLNVTANTTLNWTGATNTSWDTASQNWSNGGTATSYTDAVAVVFDDNAKPGANSIVIAAPVAPAAVIFNNNTTPYTIGGAAISGQSTVILNGSNSVTLTGANTYTGSTVINAGTLNISADANLGTAPTVVTPGSLIINGGTLADTNSGATLVLSANRQISLGGTANVINVAASGNFNIGGVISDLGATPGGFTKSGNGLLDIHGANTFTGPVVINAGTVNFGVAANAAGNGGLITVNSAGTLNVDAAITNPITLAGGHFGGTGRTMTNTFTAQAGTTSNFDLFDERTPATNANFVLTGTLNGSGNIVINAGTAGTNADAGPGMRLNGATMGNFSGVITVKNNAKVELQSTVASAFTPAGTGSIVLTGGTITADNTLNGTYSEILVRPSLAGSIPTNVSLAGTGFGMINVVSTAPSGSIITMGTVTLGDQQTLGIYRSAVNLVYAKFTNAILTGGSATFAPSPAGFGDGGTANLILGGISETSPSNVVFAPANNTAAVAGSVQLLGAGTYSGSTTLLAGSTGTVFLGAAGALPAGTALVVNGGTLDLNNSLAATAVSNDQTVGSLASQQGLATPGTITNSDPATTRTLTVNEPLGVTSAYFGNMTAKLALTKAGAGILQLGAGSVDSATGPISVTGGQLLVEGAISAAPVSVTAGALLGGNGTITNTVSVGGINSAIEAGDPGSIGTLATGALSLNSNSAYLFTLNSGLTTNISSLLNVTGALTIGAGVNLGTTDFGNVVLAPGTSFTIAQASGGVTGKFANLPTTGSQFTSGANVYSITYDANDIMLTSVPEPGSMAILTSGLGLLAGLRRFRRRG